MKLSDLPISRLSKTINEVKMSPNRLIKKALLNKYDIQVGFESEIIIPNGLSEYGGSMFSELSSRDVDSLGDVADILDAAAEYSITSQAVARNRYRELRDDFDDFISEWNQEQFEDSALSNVIDIYYEQIYDREEEIKKKLSEMGLDDAEVEESYNNEDRNYDRAVESHEEEITQEALESINDKDSYYYDALHAFIDDLVATAPSESDFLESIGIQDGSSLLAYIGVNESEDSTNYDMSAVEAMADSYADFMSIPRNEINVHDSYHASSKDYDEWYFEPDSSIESDSSDDLHIEIVSPVMQIEDALEAIKDHFDWMKQVNAVTNDSTGLHIGVSFRNTDRNEDVDLLKLAIFAGDDQVLRQFGREANSYCSSYFDKIRKYKDMTEDDIPKLLNKLKSNLSELANRTLKNTPKDKYQSINPKGDYIEFRSLGNVDYHKKLSEIQAAVGRFAYAYAIASDPKASREEYLKKLYKFLNPAKGTDLDIFTRFAVGDLTTAELKREWAAAIVPSQSDSIFTDYSIVDKQTNKIVGYVHADSSDYAIQLAYDKVDPSGKTDGYNFAKFKKRYLVEPVDERRKQKSKMNIDPSVPLDKGNVVTWVVTNNVTNQKVGEVEASSKEDAIQKYAAEVGMITNSVKVNYNFDRKQGDMFTQKDMNKRQQLAKKVGSMKNITWQVYMLPDMDKVVLELEAERNSKYNAQMIAQKKLGLTYDEWRSGHYMVLPKLQ